MEVMTRRWVELQGQSNSTYKNSKPIEFTTNMFIQSLCGFSEGTMLPSIFEKHKICSNRTKSILIVN